MRANSNDNVSRKVETTWTAKAVEDHFREAILTLKNLPPVELKGYFNAWPDIVYTPNEIFFQEKKAMRILATPEAISRLDKSFEWTTWLTVEERKLIWKRAAKVRWKTICWELGYSRATVWKRWQMACSKVANILNARQINRKPILHNKKCLNTFVVDKNRNFVI